MSKVKRVFPGPTNGLINWMEQNFHEIDGYVATFNMKDGTTMTDAESYVQAAGLADIGKDSIHQLAHDDEFIPRK
ncbi:hypothetical protein P5641_04785 [Bacillus subtilis]|nr:hypothetical protein P5641_04785 [Bacillus subtilis]